MRNSTDGRWRPLEGNEVFTCRCGQVKDGSKRGPRGGRVWVWQLRNGQRVCDPKCAALEDIEIEEADDMARGEWEAAQAEAAYDGPDDAA
jgi:hypothetical protein